MPKDSVNSGMEKIHDIENLLGQLDESTLKEFLASVKPKRTKEKTSGSSWKTWYPELVVKCATRKRVRRLINNNQ
mgnify:FL=1